MLRVENLSKAFGPVTVLSGVSETFRAHSVHGLIGANGAGKSTLIKIVSGLQEPSGGSVFLDGQKIAFSDPQDAYAAGIRTLQQETDVNLFTSLSVAENILLRTRNRPGYSRLLRKTDLGQVRERLALVGATDIPLAARVGDLPLGKRQQVALASALDAHARVLILDEPTAALDRHDAERLLEVIRSLRDHGAAIIFVSHHLSEIVEMADRVTVLREGSVADRFEMAPERDATVMHPRIIASMTGNAALQQITRRAEPVATTQAGAPLVAIKNLVAESIDGVSLSVGPGEVVTLTGLVGSGSSAILQCIYGLRPITSGQLLLDGKAAAWSDPARMVKLGIGLVPDDRQRLGLHIQQTITWNSTLPVFAALSGAMGFLTDARLKPKAREVAQRVNLVAGDLSLPAKTLSGGNQQKVVISKWLAEPRKLLLLDEPTRGVDVGTRGQIYELLRKLARENGLGVLCSTYDFDEAIQLADWIVVMKRGRIVRRLSAEAATEESLMALAMGDDL